MGQIPKIHFEQQGIPMEQEPRENMGYCITYPPQKFINNKKGGVP
jgi:hypothetical protein